MDKSNPSSTDGPRINILSWAMTMLVIFWRPASCLALVNSTSAFATLFSNLKVHALFVTRFLLANRKWIYPLLFGAPALCFGERIRGTRGAQPTVYHGTRFRSDCQFLGLGYLCFVSFDV